MIILKKLHFVVLLTVFITGFNSGEEQPKFVLKGKITGLPDSTTITLLSRRDTLGTTISKNEIFEFTGEIIGGANYYFLKMTINGKSQHSKALWLENTVMNVTGDIANIAGLHLEGSNSQKEYLEVMKIPTNQGDTTVSLLKEYVKTHTNSLYIPDLILKIIFTYDKEELEPLYNSLSADSKETFYGKKLGVEVERRLAYANFYKNGVVGAVMPNFTVTTSDGKMQALHSLTSKNKITLIDFWASWCKPCRAEVPKLKQLYSDFNAKGFEIIGISTDKNQAAWKKALSEDKTPWIQTIDNIANARVDILKMDAIPGYLIVDNNNRVIMARYFSSALAIKNDSASDKPLDSIVSIITRYTK